ncbi:Solute carrier organic anion transporter family member 1C1 [Apodemus speciosus]|uniref:Solute carrier organic anion transporter family member n=1 Tax=Apodemus speciosus TaxID=105296 RepID=A0ABQ0EWW5_APOSI
MAGIRNIFIMDTSSKENAHLFHKNSAQPAGGPSFKVGHPSTEEARSCCGKLKVFLGALSFVYFAKALAEGYLKSTITQIERRFDIPSSLVGIIDGSFEIGNLLVITFVSYFGAKLHRPKIIGAGCLVMGFGTMLIAVPQFFMEKYSYEKYERYSPTSNITPNISPCYLESSSPSPSSILGKSQNKINHECEGDASSSMWVYVFLGNLLRGLGETPIQPLGIAYLDDFASEDNAAFYIGCVQTVAIIGPIFGFLLGSLCAKLYVDIGFVNLDHITITPKDPQWVGAWWLGYLIAGFLSLLAAVPFWCLPKTLPRSQSTEDSGSSSEKSKFIIDDPVNYQMAPGEEKMKIMEMARDFLPTLKTLFRNPVYILYLCASTVQFNSLFGMVTYKPKYIEQQYGQSSSKTNFVIGLINIPAVALGIFSGGIVMKKFRLGICEAAKLYLGSSIFGYILFLSLFALGCENSNVAGLTISYQGKPNLSLIMNELSFQIATQDVNVQTQNGSPCVGTMGLPMCRLVLLAVSPPAGVERTLRFAAPKSGNWSGIMGRCGIPGYILLLRCIQPQLKSFALGIYTLAVRVLGEWFCSLRNQETRTYMMLRTLEVFRKAGSIDQQKDHQVVRHHPCKPSCQAALSVLESLCRSGWPLTYKDLPACFPSVGIKAGIPAPVYFGVLIDTSCLKWGFKKCGSRGSCRLYDSHTFSIHIPGINHAPGHSVCLSKHGRTFCFKEKICLKTQQLNNHKRENSDVFKHQKGDMCCKGSWFAAQVLARQGDPTLKRKNS